MTRRQLVRTGAVLLAIGGVAACGSDDPGASAAAAPTGTEATGEGIGVDRPVITATGVGEASGPPDALVVSLNVHTEGPSAAETLDTASLITTQLQATARAQGVADEDLQTTNVSVFPRFDAQGRRVVGYSADNGFRIRYVDLATAGAKLDELVGQGGDSLQVQGVALEIDDPTSLLAEARADAVERASTQAEQLAAAAGVELGAVRTIVEVPLGSGSDGDLQRGFPAATAFDEGLQVAVPIAAGGQQVTVQVRVVYDLAPAAGD
jgi:uncharacterized protein YggE